MSLGSPGVQLKERNERNISLEKNVSCVKK